MRSAICLIVLFLIAVITAADELDPEDLGVMTPHKAIELEPGSTRPDFSHFLIDLHPLATNVRSHSLTGHVMMTLTNALLTLTNLVRIPSGPIIMGVTSFYADGSHGEVALYKFDLRRGRPPQARAKMIGLLGGPAELSAHTNVEQAIESRRRGHAAQLPPLPLQSSGEGAQQRPPSSFMGPLPNGKPETYAQRLDAEAEKSMVNFYQKTGRRNQ